MTMISRTALLFVFSAFSGALLNAAVTTAGFAYGEGLAYETDQNRTAGRTILGIPVTPDRFMAVPDHYEFSPLVSNADPQNDHRAAWYGQDWEISKWNAKWSPDVALQKFFRARIFERLYMKDDVPGLDLGPTFYKLSDLDRRRTLKLLADTSGIFRGHDAVQLTDWYTHDVIGIYTPKGMFLN